MIRDGMVLPDVLIIGAQKAGTSALYRGLQLHSATGRAAMKETRFFTNFYDQGPDYYRKVFLEPDKFNVDATPSYMSNPNVPARVKTLLPDAKIIVALRDPIDRAHSHYHHLVRKARESGESMDSFNRTIEVDLLDPKIGPGLLYRGLYASHLKRWMKHFAPEQFFIVDFDRLNDDNQGVFNRMYDFVGLKREAVQTDRRTTEKTAMSPYMRASLHDFFREDELALADMLGRRFDWMKAMSSRRREQVSRRGFVS